MQGQYQQQKKENVQQQRREKEQEPAKKKQFSFTFSGGDQIDAELRKPRSRAYMEVFDAIDMLSATDEEIIEKLKANMDEDVAEEFSEMSPEEILAEIKATFREEFQNLPIEAKSVLHGVLSKCYIDGCDCHAISADGDVIDHFYISQPLPEELAKGRIVYNKYPFCRCIEIYSDCCRVICDDASVIKILNSDI